MVQLDSPTYGLLLVFNSKIVWPNSAPLLYISPQKLYDLEFDLSRSLKIKSNGAYGLPIVDFLLVTTYLPLAL